MYLRPASMYLGGLTSDAKKRLGQEVGVSLIPELLAPAGLGLHAEAFLCPERALRVGPR